MKLKKLFAGLVASAMAVSTMASMSIAEVSAAGKTLASDAVYNCEMVPTSESWGVNATTMQGLTSLLQSYEMMEAYESITFTAHIDNVVGVDSAQNFEGTVYVQSNTWDDWTEYGKANADASGNYSVTFKLSDFNIAAGKSLGQVGIKWFAFGATVGTNVTADITYSITTSGAGLTNDVWVDNGDGSYTFKSVDSTLSSRQVADTLPEGWTVIAKAKSTKAGTFAFAGADAATGSWTDINNGGVQLQANTETLVVWTTDRDINTPQFQNWDDLKGYTITLSNIRVIPKSDDISTLRGDTGYKQFGYDEEGNVYQRNIEIIQKSALESTTKATFTFTYGDVKKSVDVTKYYTGIKVGDSVVNCPDGYVLICQTVKGIPGELECSVALK